jgi:hypothetical protein
MGLIMLMGPSPEESWRPTYEPSREAEFSPDPARAIVAYRLWQVRGSTHVEGDVRRFEWRLCGVHPLCPAQWRKREAVAYCLSKPIAGRANSPELAVVHDDTPSPSRACTCGLSAFYEAPQPQPCVSGVVTIMGRTILHDIWLRSERARVECLALGEWISSEQREFVDRLSSEWNVPIVGNNELADFAGGVGREVPRLLRPVAPRG